MARSFLVEDDHSAGICKVCICLTVLGVIKEVSIKCISS
jgi:hypothetical protein